MTRSGWRRASRPGRWTRWLLQLYPSAWRQRYGAEMEALIGDDPRTGLSAVRRDMDVATAAVHERLTAAGLVGDRVGAEMRAKSNSLLVLAAWALFVPAGVALQKLSEHWDASTAWPTRRVPWAAFTTIQAVAAVGSMAVVVGGLLCAWRLRAWLGDGSWRQCRRAIAQAVVCGAVAVVSTASVLIWLHVSSRASRALPAPTWHLGIGVAWGVTLVLALAAATRAVIAVARQIDISGWLLGVEVWLSAVVAASMVVMTAAAWVWWLGLPAHSRDVVVIGQGSAGDLYPPALVVLLSMALASAIALVGAARARGAVREAAPA